MRARGISGTGVSVIIAGGLTVRNQHDFSASGGLAQRNPSLHFNLAGRKHTACKGAHGPLEGEAAQTGGDTSRAKTYDGACARFRWERREHSCCG